MDNFDASFNDEQDQLLIATTEDVKVNSLLSDDVVMQWLMDLEAEGLDSEAPESDAEFSRKRMHA